MRIGKPKRRAAAVLGAGPAGLFAAHALVGLGWEVDVFSRKRRSEMFGAQYLHAPIPGLIGDDDTFMIDYQLRGTVDEYRAKVYGAANRDETVSPELFVGKSMAWDIRSAYYDAWDRYSSLIEDGEINAHWLRGLVESRMYPVILSSIPRTLTCERFGIPEGHTFRSRSVYAIGDAPERGVYCPVMSPVNTVICNGEKSPAWYRVANIRGYQTAEWPVSNKPPIANVSLVHKPVATTCDCFSDSVTYIGRFGTWTKKTLAHTAYKAACDAASAH